VASLFLKKKRCAGPRNRSLARASALSWAPEVRRDTPSLRLIRPAADDHQSTAGACIQAISLIGVLPWKAKLNNSSRWHSLD
jgi:hypothetical protein